LKLRKVDGRLKTEHRIVDGVRPFLERLLAENPEIRSVIPGVIRKVRDARGPVRAHVTVATQTGWKALALSAGERQELFLNTTLGRQEIEAAMERALSGLR
jgi:hypothetical protein